MAIARLLNGNGQRVTLWEFDPAEYRRLVEMRGLPEKLKAFTLASTIELTNDLHQAVADAAMVVLAVPVQSARSVLKQLGSGFRPPEAGIVNLSKGIEARTLRRMSEIITEETSVPLEKVVTLSGPSHAEEVILDVPTTVVAAGGSEAIVEHVQQVFSSRAFRVYKSSDLKGVELGGSLKNVIAIAAGIADGLRLGDNAKGALITRGLAEITRLGVAMGARAETFAGLSGLGDLVTTCFSQHSRNRRVGERIAKGQALTEVLAELKMVAEGVETTRSVHDLARLHDAEMPITNEVFHVLFEERTPSSALAELMGRELKAEIWR